MVDITKQEMDTNSGIDVTGKQNKNGEKQNRRCTQIVNRKTIRTQASTELFSLTKK